MNEVGQLQKDGAVTDGNGKKMYNYLSEEQTTGELQRAFIKHNLVVFPIKVETEFFMIETAKYDKISQAPITKVLVTYKMVDAETGEFEEIQSLGYGSDNQDKGSNKAMTGAFKYMQRQTFMISTGDDGDHTSSEELSKQYSKPAPPQTAQRPPQSAPQGTPHNSTPQKIPPDTGRTSVPHSFKREAYSLREKHFMTWDDLQKVAERVLDQKLGKVTQIQDEQEWKLIVAELKKYDQQPAVNQ